MFDAAMRRVIDPPLGAAGRRLAALGVRPNAVTVSGFVIGLTVMPLLAVEWYWAALAVILTNRLFDGLDGAVARNWEITDLGGYLDIVCDFVFYSAVVFGFALARPENAVAAAFLIFSFMGTGSSFLAYAILAAKRGHETSARGKKSFYYLGGLTEGTETIGLFVLMCVLPDWFSPFAFVFGALCWVTTGTRVMIVRQTFRR